MLLEAAPRPEEQGWPAAGEAPPQADEDQAALEEASRAQEGCCRRDEVAESSPAPSAVQASDPLRHGLSVAAAGGASNVCFHELSSEEAKVMRRSSVLAAAVAAMVWATAARAQDQEANAGLTRNVSMQGYGYQQSYPLPSEPRR